MKFVTGIIIILLALTKTGIAQESSAHQIFFPIYENPTNKSFNVDKLSMQQSLAITQSFYQFSHYSFQKIWGDTSTNTLISIILFDTLSSWLPLGNGWLHEEWHRSVLNQYDINSYNAVYDWQLFAETISVNNLSDEQLQTLKAEHPQDFIRLHAAGLEAQSQLNLSLEKDKFFRSSKSFDYMLLWFNTINSLAYLNACSTTEANRLTRDILNNEGTDISQRDFTGLDCNAWVYDLFKPEEDYNARGAHPSGEGIQRYITYDDLSTREKEFLRMQYYLYFLNLVDPFLLSKDSFSLTIPSTSTIFTYNTNLQHYLNPFGYSINWNIFLKSSAHKYFLQWKNHFNYHRYFPALSVAVLDEKTPVSQLHYDLELSVWQQPKKLSFFTHEHQYGGLISLDLNYTFNRYLQLSNRVSYKSKGWIEGYDSLGAELIWQVNLVLNRY